MAGCVSSMSRPLVAPMSYPMSSTPSPMASLGRSRANNGTARRLVKANISIQERQSLSGRCVRAAERRGATRHTRRVAASSAKQDVEQVAGSDAEELDWANAIKFFIFPALGGLLFGYDIGATSGALVSLKSAATSGTDWGPALTPLASGAVVSSSLGNPPPPATHTPSQCRLWHTWATSVTRSIYGIDTSRRLLTWRNMMSPPRSRRASRIDHHAHPGR